MLWNERTQQWECPLALPVRRRCDCLLPAALTACCLQRAAWCLAALYALAPFFCMFV